MWYWRKAKINHRMVMLLRYAHAHQWQQLRLKSTPVTVHAAKKADYDANLPHVSPNTAAHGLRKLLNESGDMVAWATSLGD